MSAHHLEDALQVLSLPRRLNPLVERVNFRAGELPGQSRQFNADLARRNYDIDVVGEDGRAGHAAVHRGLWRLDDSHAAVPADGLEPQGAVGLRTGEHHTDGVRLKVFAQRAKEGVYRMGDAIGRIARRNNKAPGTDLRRLVRLQDVEVVRLGPHAVLNRVDRHERVFFGDLLQVTCLVRREVRHQDKGHAGIRGQDAKDVLHGLQSTGGRSEGDYRVVQRRDACGLLLAVDGAAVLYIARRIMRRGVIDGDRAGVEVVPVVILGLARSVFRGRLQLCSEVIRSAIVVHGCSSFMMALAGSEGGRHHLHSIPVRRQLLPRIHPRFDPYGRVSLCLSPNPESIIRMASVRDSLSQVLCSSKERIRISRALRYQSWESIRQSHQAILHSQEVITRSDRIIHDLSSSQSAVEEAPLPQATGGPANLLQVIRGQSLQSEVVVMDGKHFIDCYLSDCVLEYSGQAMVIESTQLSGCSFRFKGEAALTLNFLKCFGLMPGGEPDYAVAASETALTQRPN